MSTVSEAVPEISSWPSAGLLAAALASCPEAVAIVEAGIVLWCNPAHARLFGYDHAREVAGRSLADLLPKHFPCAQQPATTALNCGFPACRFHIAGNGSNERLLESSCREFRAEERRLLVIATRDITPQERRRISREGEARFRAIFEAAAIGIAHFTLDGKIVESNRALEQMLGYSHAELQGMPLVRITHPEDRAEDEHCFAEMTAGRKDQYQLEKRYVRKDGEVVWARLNVSLVRAPGGEPQFAIKLVENISERKRAEEALRESQKMEAVGRLVASLAHDFANLLTGVGILSDLLAVELRAQPGGQRAREIQLATEQGCALIRKLLFIARQHATDAKVLSLHTLVEDMRDLLAHLVEERCELTIGSEPAVGRVKADPAEMQQVVLNLVLNARDALPQGGHINLALGNCRLDSATAIAAAARPGEYVVLEVADDGCGMDENIRAHLFEPFFTTKPPGQGTGLGLATVKAIVNQSRGSIVVESAPGQGTRIRVLLPRVSGELQWNGSQAHDHPSLEGRETVLLVEDDERVRASIEQVLAKCGYRLLVAADGADALRIARRHHGPIHLLLLDMVMPGANGPEVARQIKPLHPQAKVLFISGYGLGSPEDGPESGIFRKPFTGGALARKIRETLDAAVRLTPAAQSVPNRKKHGTRRKPC